MPGTRSGSAVLGGLAASTARADGLAGPVAPAEISVPPTALLSASPTIPAPTTLVSGPVGGPTAAASAEIGTITSLRREGPRRSATFAARTAKVAIQRRVARTVVLTAHLLSRAAPRGARSA